MLEAIVRNNRILNQFLNEFRDAFQNKAQFWHFQHYVIALMIYLGDKHLSGLSRAIPDGRHEVVCIGFYRNRNGMLSRSRKLDWSS
jgi:hypothetical protein